MCLGCTKRCQNIFCPYQRNRKITILFLDFFRADLCRTVIRHCSSHNYNIRLFMGNALGYQFFNKVDAKWDNDNKNATLTLVAKYDYNDTTLQKIIDQIKGSDQNEALDFALNGNYTKAGVVARTIRGQTYVAISLRVGRNL